MIWIVSSALILGLSIAGLMKRRRRSDTIDAERAWKPQAFDLPGASSRSKYRVTHLQSGLDFDPEN